MAINALLQTQGDMHFESQATKEQISNFEKANGGQLIHCL